MDEQTRQQLIQKHLDAIREIESQRAPQQDDAAWPPRGYYLLWHVVTGTMLGMFGAGVSLLANVVGASLVGLPHLELIRVYLTFPMGERHRTRALDRQLLPDPELAAAVAARRQLDRADDSDLGGCTHAPGVRVDDVRGGVLGPFRSL